MANICTFEMRIKGTKENCEKMVNSDIPCYEMYCVEEKGTDDLYMMRLEGECRWSIIGSWVNTDEDETLAAKAAKFDIELEVIGYDISEPEWIEHYHYKGTQCLREYNLYPCIMEWQIVEMSDEDKAKYEYNEEHGMYILKKEYEEKFEWDEEEERMIVEYAMEF